LNVGFNLISDLSMLDLPANIKRLDLSGNPIRNFANHSWSHLKELNELVIEDLPNLGEIGANAFSGLPNLKRLSLEGSKNFSTLHHLAFGADSEIDLKVLNLRGCNIRTLNSSFIKLFQNLEELHLHGNPFFCDCNVKWMKELEIDTRIECNRPVEHFGKLLQVLNEKELKCGKSSPTMKKILNSLILAVLLLGCSLAIWFFFRQLKPKSRKAKFQKIGPESPYYHRVTIEPNSAEYSLRL